MLVKDSWIEFRECELENNPQMDIDSCRKAFYTGFIFVLQHVYKISQGKDVVSIYSELKKMDDELLPVAKYFAGMQGPPEGFE